ncbi:Lrp/AsnC family transcriptional regulator [Gordonia sp. PKS22-38]|uniref:Lrp/AsnC family transcriptional regulator n=1 Tax=Gordonia prachuapensis TaxID=3115651 RepID=A0ABU7MWA9_9ACTN|nr:Lrp/AsnC family transcriptional regulator [Gordonia sp. PKS22-38]
MLTSRDETRHGSLAGIDLQILEELRADGRITANDLADRVGVSRTAAARRLGQLLDEDIVRVVGIVHPLTLGIRSLAHVSLTVDKPVRRVGETLGAMPEVPFVSLASGSFPLIAEVRARDDAELAAVLDRVRSVDGVLATETLYYTSLAVDVLRPAQATDVEIDRVDAKILSHLQFDGRMPFTALAEKVGVSTGTARTRVLRMIDNGVVRIGAIVRTGRRESRIDVGVGITLRGPVSQAGDLLVEMPEVRFLAETLGRYDLLATIDANSLTDAVSVLDRLRAMRSVLRIDSWVHLDTVKESYHYPMEVRP